MPHERFRPDDTSPEAWSIFLDLLRQVPPAQRLQQAFDMTQTMRRIAEAGVRASRPQASEPEFRLRLAERWLGRTLARQLYSTQK